MCARLAFLSLAKWPSSLNECFPSITIRYAKMQQTRHLTMSASRREVVTLDCTGTIMRIKGSLPRLYLGVLEERLGIDEGGILGVSEPALLDAFRASLKQRSKELPCFGAGVMSSEEWWSEVVRTTYRGGGVPEEYLAGVFDEVFDHLFHHVFTRGQAWELVPGAKDVIDDLRAWCQDNEGPLALGVVSNFDERLHPLLQNLGVYDSFDFVLTSRECGSQKPDPYIFHEALKRAGSREANGVGVHIGDTFGNDVMGARGVGWDAVLITGRRGPSEGEKHVQHVRVGELTDVPAALGISR